MCRWLAYKGKSIFLEELIVDTENSLVKQSSHALLSKQIVNGDGFGIGWYAHRKTPGILKEISPAWNNNNLLQFAHQIRSPLFFSHVRASTGADVARSNCHPFVFGEWMFMHNGQINNYWFIRRELENMIPDAHYSLRRGTTDSEAIFLAALQFNLPHDPVGAIRKTLRKIVESTQEAGLEENLHFSAALTNGQDIYAFRYSRDKKDPSLYYTIDNESVVIVSEPLDLDADTIWHEVEHNSVVKTQGKNEVVISDFMN